MQGSASLGLHKAQGSPPNFPRLIIVQFTGILVCLELNVNGGELLLWGVGGHRRGRVLAQQGQESEAGGGQLKAWELQETAQDITGYTHTHTHTLQAVAAPTQWVILPSLLTLAAAALEA